MKDLFKALRLLSVLLKNPLEFLDRVVTFLEVEIDIASARTSQYKVRDLQEVIQTLQTVTKKELAQYYGDRTSTNLVENIRSSSERLVSSAPFTLSHNADFTFAQFCSMFCRAFQPNIVLETGVAYGVTTSFILQALELNGSGVLHSVDLPPLGKNADQFVGSLISKSLKERWHLHRGVSKRILPSLLSELQGIDIFIHDSLHTRRNMKFEFHFVTPHLNRPGVVIADDVDGNTVFSEWIEEIEPTFSAVLKKGGKKGLFGVCLFL